MLERAQRLRIIDGVGPQPSDLVVLATPVGDILKVLDQFTSGETLVTDVGSTKVAICHKAERLGLPFVGGHPMAGLEVAARAGDVAVPVQAAVGRVVEDPLAPQHRRTAASLAATVLTSASLVKRCWWWSPRCQPTS